MSPDPWRRELWKALLWAGLLALLGIAWGHPAATVLAVAVPYVAWHAVQLHRLADWHLKLGDDPVGARRALEGLERRLPDSHFARMAQQRAGQLPHDRAELLEQRKPRTLRLPFSQTTLQRASGMPV